MVELLDSEEEETKGWQIMKGWWKKREELGYFTNIAWELELEDTEGFKEMTRMDFKHFNKMLNLIAPDIMSQEIIGGNKVTSAAEHLSVTLRFIATSKHFSHGVFNSVFLIKQYPIL